MVKPRMDVEHVADIPILWGDGVHDDTEALEAMSNGLPYVRANPFPDKPKIAISRTVRVGGKLRPK